MAEGPSRPLLGKPSEGSTKNKTMKASTMSKVEKPGLAGNQCICIEALEDLELYLFEYSPIMISDVIAAKPASPKPKVLSPRPKEVCHLSSYISMPAAMNNSN